MSGSNRHPLSKAMSVDEPASPKPRSTSAGPTKRARDKADDTLDARTTKKLKKNGSTPSSSSRAPGIGPIQQEFINRNTPARGHPQSAPNSRNHEREIMPPPPARPMPILGITASSGVTFRASRPCIQNGILLRQRPYEPLRIPAPEDTITRDEIAAVVTRLKMVVPGLNDLGLSLETILFKLDRVLYLNPSPSISYGAAMSPLGYPGPPVDFDFELDDLPRKVEEMVDGFSALLTRLQEEKALDALSSLGKRLRGNGFM